MRAISILAAAILPTFCRAAVVYDNVTGKFPATTFTTGLMYELAQDITLAGGGGTLQTMELVLNRPIAGGAYDGPVWAAIYADGGGQPGALIAERTRDVHVEPLQFLAVNFDFSGLAVPGTIWVSFNAPVTMLGIGGGGTPSIGNSSGRRANRQLGADSWSVAGPSTTCFGIRASAVPTPATATLAMAPILTMSRRRRRTPE